MLKSTVFWTALIFFISLSAQEKSAQTIQENKPVSAETGVEADRDTNSLSMKIEDGKPAKFFELYGYFAFAHKYTYNMILNGNNPYLKYKTSGNSTKGSDLAKEKNISWTWLKLHLEPVINVAEIMEIHTKMSIFGNTVLGGDNMIPDSKANGILRDTQLSSSANIVFEGLWGAVDTPIGELKLGRMPFNWGLGLLYNDGNRINDQSAGNYLDRVQLTIPVAGFKIISAFDIASTGLLNNNFRDYLISASHKDDGYNLSVMFTMNEDDPALLKHKLLNNKTAFELGAMLMFSWKNKMLTESSSSKNDILTKKFIDDTKMYTYTDQSAKLWKIDSWVKLYHRHFSLKAEVAFLTGSIGKMLLMDKSDTTEPKSVSSVKTESVGVALEAEFKVVPDKFNLSLLTGVASPDDADSVQADSWNNPGNALNNDTTNSDTKVHNFRFNRNYNINSALWNQFLGRFTSGYYASLFGTYYIFDELKVDIGATYSMALYKNNSIGGQGLPNAVEPFLYVDYANKSGLRAGMKYQFGAPFDGMSKESSDEKMIKAGFYHFLNIYLGIVF